MQTISARAIAVKARAVLIAALVGWATIDLYLAATVPYTVPGATAVSLFQWDASNFFGPAAFAGGSGMVLAGLAGDLAVSLFWAAVWTALVSRFTSLMRWPLLSGVAFGVVVMLIMTHIVVPLGAAHQASPTLVNEINNLIAHTLFFGIPVAYAVRWALTARRVSQV